jgi:hypothetical protein
VAVDFLILLSLSSYPAKKLEKIWLMGYICAQKANTIKQTWEAHVIIERSSNMGKEY